jgi:DNA-binding NtrC family response regulator
MIHIPPLRERKDDIELLLRHFIKDLSIKKNIETPAIEKGLMDYLMQYSFPGNVRELRNMVERAIILSDGDKLRISDFPLKSIARKAEETGTGSFSLDEVERQTIIRALRTAGYNQVKAAGLLGISRDTLIRKRKKYGIVIKKDISA